MKHRCTGATRRGLQNTPAGVRNGLGVDSTPATGQQAACETNFPVVVQVHRDRIKVQAMSYLKPSRRAACRWLAEPFAAGIGRLANAQKEPARAAGRYTRVARSADGIGKSYMGREIAGVMGWQGAAWL